MTALATDNAGNTNTAVNTFVYDVQKPTSTINPTPYVLNVWNTVTGKANDQVGGPVHPSGIGPNNVAVAFQEVPSGHWWDGASSFNGANPTYVNASFVGLSSGTWSFTLPVGLQNALISGTSYYVVSRSSDIVGNIEFGPLSGNIPLGTGTTVIYDTAPPSAVITLPNYGALTAAKAIESIGNVTGTASGDVGVSTVAVAILKIGSPSSFWYNGSNAFNQPTAGGIYWLPATGGTPANWTYTNGNLAGAMVGSAKYVFVASATANSGLVQNTMVVPVSSFTVIMDTVAPTTSVTAPPGQNLSYQSSIFGASLPSLNGAANDQNPNPSGVKDVQLNLSYVLAGNTYYYTGVAFSSFNVVNSGWLDIPGAGPWSYFTAINWPTDGLSHAMILKSRAIDNSLNPDGSGSGNTGVPATVGTDIINFNIDNIAPTGAITYPAVNASVSSTTVQVTGPDADDLSGVGTLNIEISTGTGASQFDWNGSNAWVADANNASPNFDFHHRL